MRSNPTEYTVNRLSVESGLDRRSIGRKLATAGVEPVRIEGRQKFYSLRDAGPALWSHPRSDTMPLDQARAELAMAQTALHQIKLQTARGELVPKKLVDSTAFYSARVARDRIMALPDRLAPILAAEQDEFRVFSTMEAECRQICQELAAMWGAPETAPQANGASA
jgi:hypothetical protein